MKCLTYSHRHAKSFLVFIELNILFASRTFFGDARSQLSIMWGWVRDKEKHAILSRKLPTFLTRSCVNHMEMTPILRINKITTHTLGINQRV